MPRITISFCDKDFVKLKNFAQGKGLSFAEYLRKLVEVGSRLESLEAHPQLTNACAETYQLPGQLHNELWKQGLLCALESRYLLRYLVDNLTSQPQEKRDTVLEAVKEKAQEFVKKLMEL
ncbi:MAG: hypothetical protein QM752_00125 [Gammaproteobacteria bacterium]